MPNKAGRGHLVGHDRFIGSGIGTGAVYSDWWPTKKAEAGKPASAQKSKCLVAAHEESQDVPEHHRD